MIQITFPDRSDGGPTLPDRLLRRTGIHAAFAVPPGTSDRGGIAAHLGRWLASPGPSIPIALQTPLGDVADLFEDGVQERRCGDIRIDAALVGILRRLGVDPRAFALMAAFHPSDPVGLHGITVDPEAGDNMDTGVYHVAATIDLGGGGDIATGSGRIEIRAELPDTVIEAARGRPVDDLVDHPLLRGAGLVVHDLHLIGFGTRIVYRNEPSIALRRLADHGGG